MQTKLCSLIVVVVLGVVVGLITSEIVPGSTATTVTDRYRQDNEGEEKGI